MTKHALTFLVFRSLACWFVIVAIHFAAVIAESILLSPQLLWAVQFCVTVGIAHVFWRDASRLSCWITQNRGQTASVLAAIGVGVFASGLISLTGYALIFFEAQAYMSGFVWTYAWTGSAVELLSGLALFLASRLLGNWVDARSISAEEIARFVAENDINPVPQSDA